MKSIAGIDYSMTSPSICVQSEPNVYHIYCLAKQKKLSGSYFFEEKGVNFNLHIACAIDDELETRRFDMISDWAIECILEHKVKEVHIEGYAFNAKGRAHSTAENAGLLKWKLWKQHGITTVSVPPLEVKKFAGASKRSSDNKEPMEKAFVEETGLDLRQLLDLTPKTKNPISDIIDSYWICRRARNITKV